MDHRKAVVYAEIKKALHELRLAGDDTDISGMALLGQGGMMDSLTAMRFISAMDQRFGVNILDDLNLDCMETTDTLAAYILRTREGAASDYPSEALSSSPSAYPSCLPERGGQSEKSGIAVGQHMLIDCSHCPAAALNDANAVMTLVRALADTLGTRILKEDFYNFSPIGVTGYAIVSASHIAVHTWPEYGYMGIDIFSCRAIDTKAVVMRIQRELEPAVCQYRLINRTAAE